MRFKKEFGLFVPRLLAPGRHARVDDLLGNFLNLDIHCTVYKFKKDFYAISNLKLNNSHRILTSHFYISWFLMRVWVDVLNFTGCKNICHMRSWACWLLQKWRIINKYCHSTYFKIVLEELIYTFIVVSINNDISLWKE